VPAGAIVSPKRYYGVGSEPGGGSFYWKRASFYDMTKTTFRRLLGVLIFFIFSWGFLAGFYWGMSQKEASTRVLCHQIVLDYLEGIK